eukprot:6731820-Prymnesium_polylepis.1
MVPAHSPRNLCPQIHTCTNTRKTDVGPDRGTRTQTNEDRENNKADGSDHRPPRHGVRTATELRGTASTLGFAANGGVVGRCSGGATVLYQETSDGSGF